MNEIETEIFKLKKWFINFSDIEKSHEAYKIWARWIITYQSLHNQPHFLIPSLNIENDMQTIIELISKGSNLNRATKHYKALVSQATKLRFKSGFKFRNIKYHNNKKKKIINLTNSKTGHIYSLTNECYSALSIKFRFHKGKWKGMPWLEKDYIYNLCLRYNVLDGNSLHWALPKRLFMYLNRTFECDTELFASPFNVYFKKYYSLFDEDKYFGSNGNFFKAPDSNFKHGCYQVNPPFIEVLFDKISERIINLLTIAEESDESLTFIYIMPAWSKLDGYDMIVDNKYCRYVITLDKGHHYYFQHETQSYISAGFQSKIIFLSSTKLNALNSEHTISQIKWCWQKP